jgi:hypothetical protein
LELGKDVAFTETEDGAVLLDQRSGKYWQLNGSGALILRTLLAGGAPRDAAEAVADRYPVEAEQALTDVETLVQALHTARLVRT